MDLNRVFMTGRLTADATIIPAGNSEVCKFSIACNESYITKAGDKKENTSFHFVELWGKIAKALSPKLLKGTKIYLEGSYRDHNYEKEGVKKTFKNINASNIQILTAQPKQEAELQPAEEDSIPF